MLFGGSIRRAPGGLRGVIRRSLAALLAVACLTSVAQAQAPTPRAGYRFIDIPSTVEYLTFAPRTPELQQVLAVHAFDELKHVDLYVCEWINRSPHLGYNLKYWEYHSAHSTTDRPDSKIGFGPITYTPPPGRHWDEIIGSEHGDDVPGWIIDPRCHAYIPNSVFYLTLEVVGADDRYFDVGEEFEVRTTLSAEADNEGPITGVNWEALVLDPDDMLELVGPAPGDIPENFTLAPGDELIRIFKFRAARPGVVDLSTNAIGTSAAGIVIKDSVELDLDLELELLRVELEIEETLVELENDDEGEPIPEEIEATLRVTNVFDEDIELVQILSLNPVSLIVPPPVDDAVTVIAGPMGPGGTGVPDPFLGTIKPGQTVERAYTLSANNDGHYDVVSIVQGKDPFVGGAFTEHGSDEIKVGDDVLLYFDSSAENTVPIGGSYWVEGGNTWRVFGRLKNRSLDEPLLVLIQPNTIGNAFYAQPIPTGTNAPDSECAMGIATILDPQEEMDFIAPVRTLEAGGTRGTVRFKPKGFLINEDGSKSALTAEQVFYEKGSTEHVVRVNVADEPPVDANAFDLVGHYSVGFVTGVEEFGSGVVGLGALALQAVNFAANPWVWDDTYKAVGDKFAKYLIDIHEGLPPGEKDAYEQSLIFSAVTTLDMAFDDAKALVDTAVSQRMTKLSTAWYTGHSRDVAQILGEISGENPDFLLQALMAGYGICKLAGKGALTVERGLKGFAQSQAATLESRAANGVKALKNGDLLDYAKHLRPMFGVDELTDYMLKEFAREWDIMIVVRRRGAGVLAKLENGFFALKPYALKAKNVNAIDTDWLGFPKKHLDEVVIKEPPPWSEVLNKLNSKAQDPDTIALVRSRWEGRWKEWYGKGADPVTGQGGNFYTSERYKWLEYQRRGGIPVAENTLSGLKDNFAKGFSVPTDDLKKKMVKFQGDLKSGSDGRPCFVAKLEKPGGGGWLGVTGDIDPMAFLTADGKILPPEARLELYRALKHAGFQHPESLTWNNSEGLAEYLEEFSTHIPGTESMACYRPDGQVSATRFDAGKSWVDPARARLSAQLFFHGYMAIRSKDATPKDMSGFEQLIDGTQANYIAPDTWALTDPNCPGNLESDGSAKLLGEAQSCPIDVNYSNDPDALVLRQTKIGEVERWTPAGGWVPYVPTGSEIYLLPQTALLANAEAGDTEIEILDLAALGLDPQSTQWFEEGQILVLNPGGANEENAVIAGFGSIILEEPLEHFHDKGELISVVPNLIPGTTLTTTTTLDPGVPPEKPEVLSVTPNALDPFSEIALAISPFTDEDEGGPASKLQVLISGPLDDGEIGTIYVADVPVESPQVVRLPPALLDPNTQYSIAMRYFDSTDAPSDFSAAKSFTTPATNPVDADGDEIEDDAEYVGNTDFNGNGINDATDGFPVVKNPETGAAYAIRSGKGKIENVQTSSALEIAETAGEPVPATLFAGMTSTRTDDLAPGAAIYMFYYLPVYNLGVDRFFSYDPNRGFIDETGLMFLQTGQAVLTRTDGGDGDLDGVANGRIVSTGGPAKSGPLIPACSTPISNRTDKPIASDCLFILRAAVGSVTCMPECRCAPKGTLPITTSDALRCLRSSVGQSGVVLGCPCS
jgi:hypothetical protein